MFGNHITEKQQKWSGNKQLTRQYNKIMSPIEPNVYYAEGSVKKDKLIVYNMISNHCCATDVKVRNSRKDNTQNTCYQDEVSERCHGHNKKRKN